VTNVASNASLVPKTAAETRQIVLKEVGAKRGKFSEQDLSALKGKDDLVTQIVWPSTASRKLRLSAMSTLC
jgi:hypothetical protein